MKLAQSILWTALSTLFFITPSFAGPDISGTYRCSGYDAEAKGNYEMDLTITKSNDTYAFGWSSGDVTFSGTGIFSKSAADIIAAEFWNTKNSNKSGVIIYQVKNDGSLDGNWAYADKLHVGTEVCNKK